jgi:hypothetical protein
MHGARPFGQRGPRLTLQQADDGADQLPSPLLSRDQAPVVEQLEATPRVGFRREPQELGLDPVLRHGLQVGGSQQPCGVGLEAKAKPCGVPGGSQGSRGIVDERRVVQDAQQAGA